MSGCYCKALLAQLLQLLLLLLLAPTDTKHLLGPMAEHWCRVWGGEKFFLPSSRIE